MSTNQWRTDSASINIRFCFRFSQTIVARHHRHNIMRRRYKRKGMEKNSFPNSVSTSKSPGTTEIFHCDRRTGRQLKLSRSADPVYDTIIQYYICVKVINPIVCERHGSGLRIVKFVCTWSTLTFCVIRVRLSRSLRRSPTLPPPPATKNQPRL